MAAPSESTFVANPAAVDMAIELLGLALRSERDRDQAQGQLLRARLGGSPAPAELRDRVRAMNGTPAPRR